MAEIAPPSGDVTTPQQTVQAVRSEESARPLDTQDTVASSTLQKRLEDIIQQNEAKGVTTSVSLTSLYNGRTIYRHNASAPQFAASVNKLPVTLLVLEDLRSGKTSLDTKLTWKAEDVRSGFGTYDQPGAVTEATVGQLLQDMLQNSGNTAVRGLVIYALGGPQAVNDRLATKPQLITTRLQVLTPTTFYLGNSTSDEALWTIQKLMETEDSYQAFIREALVTNIFSYYGVRSQLEGNEYIVLANKVGFLDDPEGNNRHDVGIIYNTRTHRSYGYSFLTTTPSGNTAGTAQAEHSLDLLGRQTLRYAGDRPGQAPRHNPNARAVQPEQRVRY